jgi:hypothetical protein
MATCCHFEFAKQLRREGLPPDFVPWRVWPIDSFRGGGQFNMMKHWTFTAVLEARPPASSSGNSAMRLVVVGVVSCPQHPLNRQRPSSPSRAPAGARAPIGAGRGRRRSVGGHLRRSCPPLPPASWRVVVVRRHNCCREREVPESGGTACHDQAVPPPAQDPFPPFRIDIACPRFCDRCIIADHLVFIPFSYGLPEGATNDAPLHLPSSPGCPPLAFSFPPDCDACAWGRREEEWETSFCDHNVVDRYQYIDTTEPSPTHNAHNIANRLTTPGLGLLTTWMLPAESRRKCTYAGLTL